MFVFFCFYFLFFCFFLSAFSFTTIHEPGKRVDISWTPYYYFYPLHRYIDISQAITAESSPLQITSDRTHTGSLVIRAQVANQNREIIFLKAKIKFCKIKTYSTIFDTAKRAIKLIVKMKDLIGNNPFQQYLVLSKIIKYLELIYSRLASFRILSWEGKNRNKSWFLYSFYFNNLRNLDVRSKVNGDKCKFYICMRIAESRLKTKF